MSKIAKQHKTDAFVIPLTETCVVLSDQIEMSEGDLKKFRGVYPLFKSIAAALGKRLGPPLLCGSEVRAGAGVNWTAFRSSLVHCAGCD